MDHLPDITELSPTVTRILGQNPGIMTLQGTNCYLISLQNESNDYVLIDTGSPGPTDQLCVGLILQHLETSNGNIRHIILTHHHIDHVGGLPAILEALYKRSGYIAPMIYKYRTPADMNESGPNPHVIDDLELEQSLVRWYHAGHRIHWVTDGEALQLGTKELPFTFWIAHTPGHTSDSVSILRQETNELFTGDTILGHGTTVVGDMSAYMKSLTRLMDLKAATLYPGHGPHIATPTLVASKIQEYLDHRISREQQIMQIIIDGPSSATSMVGIIYPDLPDRAKGAAEKSVLAHLYKLRQEGRVIESSSSEAINPSAVWHGS